MTLYEAISKAMLTMLAHCLLDAPAADELGPTAQAYADSLRRHGYSDAAAQRAHDALLYLADHGDEWPTPNRVAARMRAAAAEQARNVVKLVHIPTPEARAKLREKLAAVREATRVPIADASDRQSTKPLTREEEEALLELARRRYSECSTNEGEQ